MPGMDGPHVVCQGPEFGEGPVWCPPGLGEPEGTLVCTSVAGGTLERVWPGMNSREATAGLLERASRKLGRRIVGVARGGASDASHFAPSIPLTVDGLGPRGGGAHTPDEFVLASSLGERAQVALAVALEVLEP